MTTQEKKALLLILFLLTLGGVSFYLEGESVNKKHLILSHDSSTKEHFLHSESDLKHVDKEQEALGKEHILIHINTATQETLQKLPGIGPKIAQRIVSYREENGLFSSTEDLQKVKGIGTKKMKQLKPFLQL